MSDALRAERLATVEAILALMHDAMLPFDEAAPDTIYPQGNGYGVWFTSRETAELGLTTPMKAPEIVALVEARHEAAK